MRICAIGDSFVNGTGDPDCLGWIGRLVSRKKQLHPDLTLYNLGVRRETSGDIRRRWAGEVAARLPERSLAITLTVDDDIFAIDDRVDLYALSTGRVLSTGGSIVATNDHRATIAIGRTEMSAVVAELSRGGVAVVLSR